MSARAWGWVRFTGAAAVLAAITEYRRAAIRRSHMRVISPVGGNGINIAIADAAEAGNALAPVLTIVLSLIVYQTLPSLFAGIGIVLALVGAPFFIYLVRRRKMVSL